MMTGFEALFSFYGLLLGLAIASVASGFGEMWRRRVHRRIGVLLPLFGLFILFATTRQWLSLWASQGELTISASTLIVSLAMALPYGFAAQAMFPAADDPVEGGDAHYLGNRRPLLLAVMVPLLVSMVYNLASGPPPATGVLLWLVAGYLLQLTVLGALVLTGRRTVQAAGLVLLTAYQIARLF
jgi:hypothetical protein